MNKFEQIEKYLNNYQELWWRMAESDALYPIMDVDLSLSGGEEELVEMKNKMKIMKIFFCGDCTLFPAFWIGDENVENNLDEYPIYIFDLETNEAQLCGNFKDYMSKNIENYLCENHDIEAISAKNELCMFSDGIIEKGEYPMNELEWD